MPPRSFRIALAALAALGSSPVAAGPLQVTGHILVERRVAAADGTTRVVLSPQRRVIPGDRLLVELTYRNTGTRPLADLLIADPVPRELAYQAAGPKSPTPELSLDGAHFAPTVGEGRIVAVRWRIAGALAPGAGGTLAYRAVLQ